MKNWFSGKNVSISFILFVFLFFLILVQFLTKGEKIITLTEMIIFLIFIFIILYYFVMGLDFFSKGLMKIILIVFISFFLFFSFVLKFDNPLETIGVLLKTDEVKINFGKIIKNQKLKSLKTDTRGDIGLSQKLLNNKFSVEQKTINIIKYNGKVISTQNVDNFVEVDKGEMNFNGKILKIKEKNENIKKTNNILDKNSNLEKSDFEPSYSFFKTSRGVLFEIDGSSIPLLFKGRDGRKFDIIKTTTGKYVYRNRKEDKWGKDFFSNKNLIINHLVKYTNK